MKYIKSLILSIMTAAAVISCGPRTTEIVNPLTYTDVPDPDVIRVGDDYYMISTTMYYCPGAPIMHSKDLVHWELVNYVYDYLEDDDLYNLRNGKNAYGKSQWAASLRYENGLYYALFMAHDQHKTYIYTTEDIENGPWKRNVIDTPFHDASMLFDDGRLYLVWGNGEIYIIELEPDASAIKEGSEPQLLISTPREGYSLRGEGAHVYHIGDYYYILLIDWPRGGVRTQTCYRSKELFGEYERKTILSGSINGRGDGVAQGAIFETQNGDWYGVIFQDNGAVGRIPTLQPVTWVDDWPILGDNTVPLSNFTVNLAEYGQNRTWDNDEFDYQENKLDIVWQWNHKPINEDWSVTEREGWLRLKTSQLATNIFDARNSLTQRTVGPRCYSEVEMDASGLNPGDFAGLCAFQSNHSMVGVCVDEDGQKYLYAEGGARVNPEFKFKEPLKSELVKLRIDYDFSDDTALLSYSYDGENWEKIDYKLKMRFTLDLFTGYRSALYCYSTSQTGGHADFNYFHQATY